MTKAKDKEAPAVASIGDASPEAIARLRAEVAALTEQLAAQRSDSEKKALALAESQGAFMQREIREVPTGRFKTVPRCVGYKRIGFSEGRAVREPVFEDAEVPTFFYKVDMPPVGGTDYKVPNGVPMEQGVVYEYTLDELSSLKEIIFRLWQHDHNISGSNENFYRKPLQPHLSARG